MNRRNFLKGFLAVGAVVALAPLTPVVELSTVEAEFLTFDQIAKKVLDQYRQVFVDSIMKPSPLCLKMKELNLIPSLGTALIEPIHYA